MPQRERYVSARLCVAVALLCAVTFFSSEAHAKDPDEDDAVEEVPPPLPIKLSMFIDAYATYQTSGNGTLLALSEHLAATGQGATHRAESGLGLAFFGVDAELDMGSFGAVANLRLGQGAKLFHGDNDFDYGIDLLTQAYALYRPLPALELNAGMFISPFGYEALESYKNPNYTISALYTYGQPNWHTGFRAKWQATESLTLMALVINGINNISETQQQGGLTQRPNVGGMVTYEISSALSVALGGLLALDQSTNDDEGYDGFGDLTATLQLGPLLTALNANYIYSRDGAPDGSDRHFFGVLLVEALRFNDMFGVAVRGEYLRDQANYDGRDVWVLWTGTITLDVKPIPRKQYLVVRWENRWEHSNQRIFGKDSRGTEDTEDDTYRHNWWQSVLGVVVTTNL